MLARTTINEDLEYNNYPYIRARDIIQLVRGPLVSRADVKGF